MWLKDLLLTEVSFDLISWIFSFNKHNEDSSQSNPSDILKKPEIQTLKEVTKSRVNSELTFPVKLKYSSPHSLNPENIEYADVKTLTEMIRWRYLNPCMELDPSNNCEYGFFILHEEWWKWRHDFRFSFISERIFSKSNYYWYFSYWSKPIFILQDKYLIEFDENSQKYSQFPYCHSLWLNEKWKFSLDANIWKKIIITDTPLEDLFAILKKLK
jgi:hypothetical protein